MLSYSNRSLVRGVRDAYPELEFDELKFNFISSMNLLCSHDNSNIYEGNYWRDHENKRQFFDNFAAKKKFDPNDPKKWDSITRQSVILERVS